MKRPRITLLLLTATLFAFLLEGTISPASAAGSSFPSGGFGGLSYACGTPKPGDPFDVPAGSRVCTCKKSIAGDCKAMENEACSNGGFLKCPVGVGYCYCVEKDEGPTTPRKIIKKRQQKAPSGTIVAPPE